MTPLLLEVLERRAPEAGPLQPRISPETHYRHLRYLCETAGVPVVTWHPLRHSYATALIDAGATLHEVQAVLGHRSLTSTGIYLHARVESVARVSDRAWDAAPPAGPREGRGPGRARGAEGARR